MYAFLTDRVGSRMQTFCTHRIALHRDSNHNVPEFEDACVDPIGDSDNAGPDAGRETLARRLAACRGHRSSDNRAVFYARIPARNYRSILIPSSTVAGRSGVL